MWERDWKERKERKKRKERNRDVRKQEGGKVRGIEECTGGVWHKVNEIAKCNWFEFKVFFLLAWLLTQSPRAVVYTDCISAEG